MENDMLQAINSRIYDMLMEDYPSLQNPKGFRPTDRYQCNGINVPRVTTILDKTIGKPGLMTWANSLGFKHIGYYSVLNEAAAIGSETHNYIEDYIQKRDLKDIEHEKAANCISAFKNWWDLLTTNYTVEVLGEEQRLSCPWFGGTYDLLLKIDNEICLIDFKTSNSIKVEYFYQLAAYRYLIYQNLGIDINSCMILRLSKIDDNYETCYVDITTPEGLNFMNNCAMTFFSLVNSYLRLARSDYEFKEITKGQE